MTKVVRSDPQTYAELEDHARRYDAPGRTGSVALLLWFLETVYRLDEVEAEDAVCDGSGDSGFDGVAANDLRREIVVFQGKRREKLPATLGDVDLKTFVGSLSQLSSGTAVKQLAANTRNADLRLLLQDLDVAAKIDSDYTVRAIFVANVAANHDAKAYHVQAVADRHNVDLWDLTRLRPVLDQLRRDWFVPDQVRLELDPKRLFASGHRRPSPSSSTQRFELVIW